MTLEVSEVYHEIIVCKMIAHQIFLEPFCILHRQIHFTLRIHYVNRGDLAITTLLNGTSMGFRIRTVAAVSGITLHDVAFYFLHKRTDQFGAEMIALSRFTGTDFHGYFAFRLYPQRIENIDE